MFDTFLVSSAEALALSTPSSSQEPNRAAADSSQRSSTASAAATPVITVSSQLPQSEASDKPKEHHHHHRESREKDRERRHHRERDKEREKRSTPRPDSHISATAKWVPQATQAINVYVRSSSLLGCLSAKRHARSSRWWKARLISLWLVNRSTEKLDAQKSSWTLIDPLECRSCLALFAFFEFFCTVVLSKFRSICQTFDNSVWFKINLDLSN